MKEFKKGSKYFLNFDKSFEIKQLEETGLGKTYEFIASKEIEDRDGDTILIDGIDLSNLGKNMPSLFNHNPHFVIGHIVDAKKVKKELRVTIFVLKDAAMPSGVRIIDAVDAGSLKAVSIGFMINEWKAKDPDNIWGGWTIEKCELLEVSIVSIPANKDALRIKSKIASMSDDDFTKILKSVEFNKIIGNIDLLPVHDIKDWDSVKAIARVKELAKEDDEMYHKGFMFVEKTGTDIKTLLPFTDVVDGELVAVKSAINDLYKTLDTDEFKDIPETKKNEIKSLIKSYSEQQIVEIVQKKETEVDYKKAFETFTKTLDEKLKDFGKELDKKTLTTDQVVELIAKKLKEVSEPKKSKGLNFDLIVKDMKK